LFVGININRHVLRLLVRDAGRWMRRVRKADQADEGETAY
jgi:Sec-independent protein translocase protein TatA